MRRPTTCGIIIPTRHRASLLAKTLDSLALQSEKDFEVIVVCDGDDPDTRTFAGKYKAVFPLKWIFLTDQMGIGVARNTGAQAAEGELLLFLDDDTLVSPDWLFQHLKHHRASGMSENLIVRGRYIHIFHGEAQSQSELYLRLDAEACEAEDERILTRGGLDSIGLEPDRIRHLDVNCSVNRLTFLRSGGFDSSFNYFAGVELGMRLYERGIRTCSNRTQWPFTKKPRTSGRSSAGARRGSAETMSIVF